MNHLGWKVSGHRASTWLLVAMVWISLLLFGLYILAFYLGARLEGNAARWNEVLPGRHVPGDLVANTATGPGRCGCSRWPSARGFIGWTTASGCC